MDKSASIRIGKEAMYIRELMVSNQELPQYFGGKDKRVHPDEKAAWHPDDDVFWQENAWADTTVSVN